MDQASEIREKIDLVSFISEFIPLKKMGRNFKANCPFHNEKTPSFVVSAERQIWHCFGCAKGGDCFTFLMEYEHIEFVEALRTLAKRVGVQLKETFDNKVYSRKEKIYNLNKIAAKFYNFLLTNHEVGKPALNYLIEKRKLSKALIETYQLGFSPNNSSSLTAYLINKKGYKKTDLYDAGLSFERGGKVVDFFKGRIIFPLLDHRDNVVGFSGRGLTDNDQPKYINTKETEAYHKGDMFFGLSAAKEEIKKLDQAIIVEGEFDVISCFKEGIKNVVAVKGTALTENQVALLSRFTKKITLCLDQDKAGLDAMKRSLSILEKKDLLTTVVIPTSGKDPDEAIKNDPYAFKKAIKEEKPVYDFLFEKTLSEIEKKDVLSKKKIADTLLPFITQISNEVIKEHYLRLLSKEIETSYESLIRETEKISSSEKKEKIPYKTKDKRTRREILEEYFLALIIQSSTPKITYSLGMKKLLGYKFEDQSISKIIDNLGKYFDKIEEFDSKKISRALPEELLKTFDTCFLLPLPKFEGKEKYSEEIEKAALEMLTIFAKEEIKVISENLKTKGENSKESEGLRKQLSELFSLLPKTSKT